MLNFVKNINVPLPVDAVYSRLGRYRHKLELTTEQKIKIEQIMFEGFALCEFQGVWSTVKIIQHHEEKVVLDNNMIFKSESLAEKLAPCRAVVLMALTAGAAIVESSAMAMNQGDGLRGLIYDAVGSESCDDAVGVLQKQLTLSLRRQNMLLTPWRFSPGYGGLSLDVQKDFVRFLQMEKLGVTLSVDNIMFPEKTVTCIIGIYDESN